jgi:hypothetical protein
VSRQLISIRFLLIPARHVRPAESGLIVRANHDRLRAEGPE